MYSKERIRAMALGLALEHKDSLYIGMVGLEVAAKAFAKFIETGELSGKV